MRLLALALSLGLSSPAWAVGFVSGRLGAGGAGTKGAYSATYNGTVRLGNNQPQWQTFIGLDLSAFKILKNKKLPDAIDGNIVSAYVGYWQGFVAVWAGYGGGQLRVYNRPDPDSNSPREYVSREAQVGAGMNLYEAEHGQVTFSLTAKQLMPGDRFVRATGLDTLDMLQMEIGFLLSNW